MLFKSLPCGAKTCWQARALGLASSLLPLVLLVSLAQAQTGYHMLSVPGSTYEVFRHMAVDGNGKIYIAATCGRTDGGFSVIALLPTGSLDPAWGTGGVVSTKLTAYGSEARGIAIDPNGRIVVTGNATRKIKGQYDKDLAVVRYNPDGSLDMSFNYVPPTKKQPATYGIVITDFGGGENGENVIFQSDGKIVVGGTRNSIVNLATFRYNSNGTLDTTYGIGGKAEGSFGVGYRSVFDFYPDDLAFHMDGILYGIRLFDSAASADCIGLMRFQGTGLGLDARFGNAGTVTYRVPDTGSNIMWGLAVDSIGRIVTVATLDRPVDGSWFVVYRFNPDGSLDPSLGEGRGYRGIDCGGYAVFSTQPPGDIAIDANGKAVIAGKLVTVNGPSFVGRIDVDSGTLDTSFGGTGVVVMPAAAGDCTPLQVAILPDGRIVVGGRVYLAEDNTSRIFVARFLSDGTLDPDF